MTTSSNVFYCVAEVYCGVLFDVARQQQAIEAVKADMDELEKFLFADISFVEVMTSPYFPYENKSRLIDRLFGGKLHDLTVSFLHSVAAHNRCGALYHMIKRFNKLYKMMIGYKDVWITVSHALDQDEIDSLKASLASALNTEKIGVEFNVEPAIIGGTIIKYEGKMIDNSIRTRLRRAVDTVISQGRNSGKKK